MNKSKANYNLKYLKVLLFFIPLISCVDLFKYPISSVNNSYLDKKLLGSWKYKDDNEIGYFHIYKLNNSTNIIEYDLKLISIKDKVAEHGIEQMKMHLSSLNKKTYMNIKFLDKKNTYHDKYLICRYNIRNNKLFMYPLNSDSLKFHINSTNLNGEISKYGVEITNTTEEIIDFLKTKNDPNIFDKQFVYKFFKIK